MGNAGGVCVCGRVYQFVSGRVRIVHKWCNFAFPCVQMILIHMRQPVVSADGTSACLRSRAPTYGRLFSNEIIEFETSYLAEFEKK